jgi:hypothetical protein
MEKMIESDREADAFIETLPSSINSVFFDNPLVNSLYKINGTLIDHLFGKKLADEVNWFLYEWKEFRPENLRTITYENPKRNYIISNLDDFVDYAFSEGMIHE